MYRGRGCCRWALGSDESLLGLVARVACAADKRTTLMIRNIPNKYTQKMLLNFMYQAGFEGKFDFFYLPIDFRNSAYRC